MAPSRQRGCQVLCTAVLLIGQCEGLIVGRTNLQGLRDEILSSALIQSGEFEQVNAKRYGNDRAFATFSGGEFGIESGFMISTGDAYEYDLELPSRDFSPTATETGYMNPAGDEAGMEISFVANVPVEFTFQFVFASRDLPFNIGKLTNDKFTMTMNDVGFAYLSDGKSVTINSLGNSGQGPFHPDYINNTKREHFYGYTGYTKVREVQVTSTARTKNTFNISIADVMDGEIDSVAFIHVAERKFLSRPRVYKFVTASWGPCSVTCGDGGVRQRAVTCVESEDITSQGGISVDDLPCTDAGQTKPADAEDCTAEVIACGPYVYMPLSQWSACSTTCGIGQRTREAYCLSTENQQRASEAICFRQEVVGKSKPCDPGTCPDVRYRIGQWGGCSTTCGPGVISREVVCETLAGVETPLDGCGLEPPDATKLCANAAECPVYQLSVSQWSACSNECGVGSQTRSYTCVNTDNGNTVSDSFCPPPPNLLQVCNQTLCPPCASWTDASGARTQTKTFTDVTGYITDGGGVYGNDVFCAWKITPANMNPITLRFSEIMLEKNHDFLRIYDGPDSASPLLAFIHGDLFREGGDASQEVQITELNHPGPYTAQSGSMYITLTTDSWKSKQGFFGAYQVMQGQVVESDACEGEVTFTDDTGAFNDGTGNYQDGTQCTWRILPEHSASKITLSFAAFALENQYDFVRVYEGTGEKIAELTGDIVTTVEAFSGSMLVVFSTDGDVSDKGFEASYAITSGQPGQQLAFQSLDDVVKDSVLTSKEGQIDSSTCSAGEGRCTWVIQPAVPPGALAEIRLKFASFSTEQSVDYVNIMDGSKQLGMFTGTQIPSEQIATSGTMEVTLHKDSSQTMGAITHISATYTSEYYCSSMTTLTLPSQPIVSGSWSYQDNTKCMWLITPSQSVLPIVLSFSEFMVEAVHDDVKVYSGRTENPDNLLATLSGSFIPQPIQSSSSSMLVVFKSDITVNAKGFVASWTTSSGSPDSGAGFGSSTGSLIPPSSTSTGSAYMGYKEEKKTEAGEDADSTASGANPLLVGVMSAAAVALGLAMVGMWVKHKRGVEASKVHCENLSAKAELPIHSPPRKSKEIPAGLRRYSQPDATTTAVRVMEPKVSPVRAMPLGETEDAFDDIANDFPE